jgi:hypothetical protein
MSETTEQTAPKSKPKRLTDVAIRHAKPGDRFAREDGLQLRVEAGGTKRWLFKYEFQGKETSRSYGTYPTVPLSGARERAEADRKLLAAGVNPAIARRDEKVRAAYQNSNTFRTVAMEWLNWKTGDITDGTHRKAQWMLETFAFPALGDMPLDAIQPPDVLKAMRAVEKTGKLETMHRTKARISEVFRFAIGAGRATTDPTRDLRGLLKAKPKTRHHAALTDPAEVGQLLRAIWGYSGTPEVLAALKLSALLWQRPGEIRTMQWPQVKLDDAEPAWRYVASKTGTDHIVP